MSKSHKEITKEWAKFVLKAAEKYEGKYPEQAGYLKGLLGVASTQGIDERYLKYIKEVVS